MTSLISWVGVDSRGPSSVYIASDSRIAWNPSGRIWDSGRKTFACARAPYVFGFAGDVLFPSLALSAVVDLLDVNAIKVKSHRPFGGVGDHIWRLADAYPRAFRGDFTVLMACRLQCGMASRFVFASLGYRAADSSVQLSEIEMPKHSASLKIAGSGAGAVSRADLEWQKSPHAKTSRAVYSAFCDSLASGEDPHSGGPPQLVGMYRKGEGRVFGTVYNGKRYIAGSRVANNSAVKRDVQWHNTLFEIIDDRRLARKLGAKSHEPL